MILDKWSLDCSGLPLSSKENLLDVLATNLQLHSSLSWIPRRDPSTEKIPIVHVYNECVSVIDEWF